MATTPGKPRLSGIPTPGRTPTAGRIRSASSVSSQPPPLPTSAETLDLAFADAIKTFDPSRFAVPATRTASHNTYSSSTSRPVSAASGSRPRTPSAALSKSTSVRRPESRQSDLFSRTQREFVVGDNVRIESLGFEGTLRYVGEIDGKTGVWAGVELSGGFAGKGKNDGSVGEYVHFMR